MSGDAIVTFTPYTITGLIDPLNSINLKGNYVYGGTKYSHERWNQVAKRTLDGGLNVEDNGVEIITSQLRVEAVEDAEGYAFRDWIRNTIKYRLLKFRAEPQDVLLDIGAGRGVTVDNCNFSKTNLNDVFTPSPPNNFTIIFPFQFKAV